MRKIILELTTETDDSLSNILWDLEREICCASNSYDVVGIREAVYLQPHKDSEEEPASGDSPYGF